MIRRPVGLAAFLVVLVGTVSAQQSQRPPRDLPPNQNVGTGAITGIVRAADTGAPLRGAEIRLAGANLETALGGVRGAFTDASGRYEFSGLPEGRYTLAASKVRYLTMSHGQTRAGDQARPVGVVSGQRVENIDFALPAGAVIVLRVGDHFGDPAAGFRVNLYQARFSAGERSLAPVPTSSYGSVTDDRGEIRLSGLAPGEYYVSAGSFPSPPYLTATGAQEVQTFYPGSVTDAEAQAITVGLGEEVVVAFKTVFARAARVSGSIVGANGSPDVRMGRRVADSSLNFVDVDVAADGSFSAMNLAPGNYEITAATVTEIGSLRVAVAGEDVTGLVLTMRPVVPLRGKVTFEGTQPAGIAQAAFVLRPEFTETPLLPDAARYKPDWTFEIPALDGTGLFRADLPPGWFLQAVRLDGRDVTDTVMDFLNYQGKEIEVVFTQRAAEITGRVIDDAGRDIPNFVAVVFPEDQQRWTPLTRTIARVRPDQQGRFSFRGLPPGRYLVAAIDYLQYGQERDARTLERLRARATAVTLTEDATQNVTVTVLP
jgi:protocatechuate 3,4-dioxygenase beta subunit